MVVLNLTEIELNYSLIFGRVNATFSINVRFDGSTSWEKTDYFHQWVLLIK
jgi:hypothetical protein